MERISKSAAGVLVRSFLAIAAFAVSSQLALAQEPIANSLKPSLVHLIVKAIPDVKTRDGATPGLVEFTRGTGFVVSSDGYILTNYHLVKDLTGYKPGSLFISASFGEFSETNRRKLQMVKSDAAFDLLLLKGAEGSAKYNPVTLAPDIEIRSVDSDQELISIGFPRPENEDLQTEPVESRGRLKDKNGPDAHLWNVSLTMNSGQSGSPIINSTGRVVGIGTADSLINKETNFMIPAYLASSLMAHLKFGEYETKLVALEKRLDDFEKVRLEKAEDTLEKAVENIDEIASNFEWSAKTEGDHVMVAYEKLANTGPQIDAVTIRATPLARGKGGPVNLFTLVAKNSDDPEDDTILPDVYDPAKRRGVTLAKGLFVRLKNVFCEADDAVEMTRVKIDIEPFLQDNVPLDPESIFLEHSLDKKTDCKKTSVPPS
jgi:S1-C subfamily serine protease